MSLWPACSSCPFIPCKNRLLPWGCLCAFPPLSATSLLPLCLGLCLLVFPTPSFCHGAPPLGVSHQPLPQVPRDPPPSHDSLSAQSSPGFLLRAIPGFAEEGVRPHQPRPGLIS